jgi:N-methylhydantoinase B
MDGVHVHMSNTLNTPVEALETAYPLRVRRYAFRPDSGGPGEFRGGLGLRRDIEVRGETQVSPNGEARRTGPTAFSLLADRHRSQPYGLAGGEPGASGAAFLTPVDAEDSEQLPPKTTLELSPGDTVSIRSPGGGGYGDPSERARTAIERDLRLGKLTREAARTRYGYEPTDSSEAEDS